MTQKISNYNNFAKEWDQTRKHAWGEFEFAQKLLPANNILDAGCGNGRLVNWLRQNKFTGKYLGIDISSKLIKIAKKNFPKEKFEIADLRNFQQAKQFDTIFSIATLHHITNPSEQKQVLKNSQLLVWFCLYFELYLFQMTIVKCLTLQTHQNTS